MIRPAATVLAAIERECLRVDKAIVAREWDECEASWIEQRRLTHELQLAIAQLPAGSPEASQAAARIVRLTRYRDGQLRKLRAFNGAVSKRLATIERFRSFVKGIEGGRPGVSSLLDVTQ